MKRLAIALVLSLGFGHASADELPAVAKGVPLVVNVHADWCGTCRRLEPVLLQLRQRVGETARFATFDISDEDAVERSVIAARALGLEDFFKVARDRTGIVAVFSGQLGAPFAVLKGESDVAVYEAAIEQARVGRRSESAR